jgi:hypothetical protein
MAEPRHGCPGAPKLNSPDAEDEEDIGAGGGEVLAVNAGAEAAPFLFALVFPGIATKPGENVQSMVLVFDIPIEEAGSFSGLGPEDAAAIAARARHVAIATEPLVVSQSVRLNWFRYSASDCMSSISSMCSFSWLRTFFKRPSAPIFAGGVNSWP